jgi:DNA (cytosine-5)-methyltransferase 1
MEQVRIVKEMRAEDKRNGRTGNMVRPRFLVWENVVGAFSSNRGKDFHAVLEEIARIAEPGFSLSGLPEKWKWTKAGAIDGDGWSIAWRTHDAKDWGKTIRDSRTGNVIRLGTPQRRRRISVVADFGGESAAQIQFDRESVSGDIAESGAAGERPAGAAESGFNPAVGDCMTAWDCQSKRIFDTNGKSPTLQGGVGGGVNNPAIFVAIPINDKATRWQGGGESRNHDGSGNGLGIGKEGDPSPTLNAECGGNKPAVVALDMTHACDVIRECGEQAPSLQARMGTGRNQVPLTYQMNGFGDYRAAEVASSCKQRDFKDSTDLVCAVDCRNFREGGEVNGTLQAKESGGQSLNLNNTVRQNMVVRLLTPMECERLQGFPDGWTDIGDWVKTDKRGREIKVKGSADSPRYKALGNSIALPFWDWMLRRMARYLPEDATLGSLFDGIAGFPLIWERIHGKGTARWASEIEPFPIAVTKKHFPEEE